MLPCNIMCIYRPTIHLYSRMFGISTLYMNRVTCNKYECFYGNKSLSLNIICMKQPEYLVPSFHIYTTLPFAFNQNICRFFNTPFQCDILFPLGLDASVHALVSHVYLCECLHSNVLFLLRLFIVGRIAEHDTGFVSVFNSN